LFGGAHGRYQETVQEELVEAADEMVGDNIRNLANLTLKQIYHLMTVTQFITDLCLNEVERRGELTYAPDGEGGLAPIMPYYSEHYMQTVLTRRN
jgi:hypothetical protein